MAGALEPGGATHDILADILQQIEASNKRAEKAPGGGSIFSGLTIKEAIALKILGEKGLSAVAKGLGALAEVIDGMKTEVKRLKKKWKPLEKEFQQFKV
jgi:phage shock protein A